MKEMSRFTKQDQGQKQEQRMLTKFEMEQFQKGVENPSYYMQLLDDNDQILDEQDQWVLTKLGIEQLQKGAKNPSYYTQLLDDNDQILDDVFTDSQIEQVKQNQKELSYEQLLDTYYQILDDVFTDSHPEELSDAQLLDDNDQILDDVDENVTAIQKIQQIEKTHMEILQKEQLEYNPER